MGGGGEEEKEQEEKYDKGPAQCLNNLLMLGT